MSPLFHEVSGRMPTHLVLPQRVLKGVLVGHNVGIGARVLDAGCRGGELLTFLQELGIEAFGLEDDEAAARHAPADLPIQFAQLDVALPFAAHQFDLVLVRDLKILRQDLLSVRTRLATANLAACVRPGGHLLFLHEESIDQPHDGHRATCFRRHLAGFPGAVETADYHASPIRRLRLWRAEEPASVCYHTTSLHVPSVPLSREGWQLAARRLETPPSACCAWSETQAHAASHRRKSA